MRSFIIWTAVLAITAGSFATARAEDKKDSAAPAAAVAAGEPTDAKKESAPVEAATAATEKKPAPSEKAAAKPEPAKQNPTQTDARQLNPNNPWSKKVKAYATALASALNDEQTLKMAEMLMGYNMMITIRMAEKDVSKAVEACGEKNPDIKDKMSTRLDKWKHAVDPALTKSEDGMHAAIKSKIAGDPGKVRDYFDLVEKYGEYEEVVLKKQPVTSAEACERLLTSMDRSQIALTEALGKIKWPLAGDPAAKTPEKTVE